MATKKQAQATKVRVLVEGHYGKPDDVIELDGDELAQALASGQVDPHPDAVAYAEGWATDGAPKEKASKPASNKAHKAAPENK